MTVKKNADAVNDETVTATKSARGVVFEHREGATIVQRRWLGGEAAKKAWELVLGYFRK